MRGRSRVLALRLRGSIAGRIAVAVAVIVVRLRRRMVHVLGLLRLARILRLRPVRILHLRRRLMVALSLR